MKSKVILVAAIMVGLLLTTSTVLGAGVNMQRMEWGSCGTQQSCPVKAYVNNPYNNPITVYAYLQLSVPGWYTKSFSSSKRIDPGNGYIEIPYMTEANWPKGYYNAVVTISPAEHVSSMGGRILIV